MNEAQEEKTVTIYKVTCTKGYQITDKGTGFSLAPWGRNTDYFEGFDDGGKEYVLLDGYHVAESNSGSLEIYDPANQRCAITNRFGKPCIVTNRGAITLKRKN